MWRYRDVHRHWYTHKLTHTIPHTDTNTLTLRHTSEHTRTHSCTHRAKMLKHHYSLVTEAHWPVCSQKGRWRPELDTMRVGGLMPIASSPRDSDIPATPRSSDHAALPNTADVDMAACTALPSTPPASDNSSGIDIREPVKLIGEEEEEEEEELEDQEGGSNCGCHRDVGRDNSAGLFPLTDLDLEQIENHWCFWQSLLGRWFYSHQCRWLLWLVCSFKTT